MSALPIAVISPSPLPSSPGCAGQAPSTLHVCLCMRVRLLWCRRAFKGMGPPGAHRESRRFIVLARGLRRWYAMLCYVTQTQSRPPETPNPPAGASLIGWELCTLCHLGMPFWPSTAPPFPRIWLEAFFFFFFFAPPDTTAPPFFRSWLSSCRKQSCYQINQTARCPQPRLSAYLEHNFLR